MLARNVDDAFLVSRREIDMLWELTAARNHMLAYNVQNVFLESRPEINTLGKSMTVKRGDATIRKSDMMIHTVHALLPGTIP